MEQNEQNPRLDTILQTFQSYHCEPNSLLTKSALFQILDRHSDLINRRKFDPDIAQEIFGQAETLSRGECTVMTISKIIAEALTILQNRLATLQNQQHGIPMKIRQLQLQQKALQILEEDYHKGFQQNYDKINTTRRNINLLNTEIVQYQQMQANFTREYKELSCLLKAKQNTEMERTYIIPAPQPVQPQKQTQTYASPLAIILGVSLVCLLLELELLLFSFRPNFLALFVEIMIVYWLFYGYYDQHSVKYLLAALSLSCLIDISYLCLFLLGEVGTTRHSGQNITTIVLVTLLVIQTVARVFLVVQLFPYRQPPLNVQYFEVFGHRVYLNLRSGKRWVDR